MPSPVTVTINPSSVRVPEGTKYSGHITVTNDSQVKLTVHPLILSMNSQHSCTQSVPWLHVTTTTFKLPPLASHGIAYTVSGHGNGTAAVVAEASAPTDKLIHISGAVGTKIVLGTGQQVCTAPKAQPLPPAPGGGTPWWMFAAVAAAVLLAVVVVIRAWRRHRAA